MSFDRELLSHALPAYDIGDQLGQGGMGVVISGQHRQLGRRVAIKQLPAAFAADPDVRRRFTAEARVLASLDHPHVVPVYDFVERDGVCLLVMELLPGGTLRSRVTAAGGFTAPHAVAVCLAAASGLAAAHRHGVLHRDVKPENMLFAASGVLKVADFGIAKVLGGAGTVLTRRGEMIGTLAYIAPEQVRGEQVSPATDVYAAATMLYELLGGALPFPDDGEAEDLAVLFKHAYEKPVPLREVAPGVPDPVAAAVMRALATNRPTGSSRPILRGRPGRGGRSGLGRGMAGGRAGPHHGRGAHRRRGRTRDRAPAPGRTDRRAGRACGHHPDRVAQAGHGVSAEHGRHAGHTSTPGRGSPPQAHHRGRHRRPGHRRRRRPGVRACVQRLRVWKQLVSGAGTG